ncbi:OmpA family protein [Geomonas sp. RF6]|uniref:OmpA family protein n=1 Tax=Geomonas sp. RF6 TaxID=2897342 RepID=UPI001E391595|nr:OmpA family protein [Geomonas sp. RF6]UFS69328.1 OmpA family protein [Geomonas sp. RF6]
MRTIIPGTLLFLLVLLTCSCAQNTLVALVPDPAGGTGRLTVTNKGGRVAIDAPYRATTVADEAHAPSAPLPVKKDRLEKMFSEALSMEPPRPLHFLLHFREDTDLAPESVQLLPQIVAAIGDRRSGFISIVGHSDTLGTKEYNLDLAHKRAVTVEQLLVGRGVDPKTITMTWYGEKGLLIPTGDDVWEQKNRATEVVVR